MSIYEKWLFLCIEASYICPPVVSTFYIRENLLSGKAQTMKLVSFLNYIFSSTARFTDSLHRSISLEERGSTFSIDVTRSKHHDTVFFFVNEFLFSLTWVVQVGRSRIPCILQA